MNKALLFSSASEEWATPADFFQELNEEFRFELDAAATAQNHKCPRFYDKAANGLLQTWAPFRTFLNPPYGRGVTGQWVQKARIESRNGALVVLLLPARTDTRWFHDYIWDEQRNAPRPGVEVRFLRGRLKFGGSKDAAPFPSMVAVLRPQAKAGEFGGLCGGGLC